MESPNTTIIRIENIDGSYRIIKPIGNYSYDSAYKLGKDLEGSLLKNIIIHK